MGNKIKRQALFKYFRDREIDIVFMQEVHCTKNVAKLWENESGFKWYTSSGNSNSRGTVTMINPKCKVKINKSVVDHEGRNVLTNIEIDEQEFSLCNLYAPNEDKPEFFRNTFNVLQKFAKEHIIVGGDFNLALNNDVDRLNCIYNKKSTTYVKEFMETFNLTDVWRDRNVDDRKYTWFKRGNCLADVRALRIDFFLINTGLACNVLDTKITVGCRTDHS